MYLQRIEDPWSLVDLGWIKVLTRNSRSRLAVLENGTLPLQIEETATISVSDSQEIIHGLYQTRRIHHTYTLELPIAAVAEKKRAARKV